MNPSRGISRKFSSNMALMLDRTSTKTISVEAKQNLLDLIERAMDGYLETKIVDLESG